MVKNSGGGNKAKKFASKSINISNRATRFASESGEVYAIVSRMMGNNMCEVLCIDGNTRLCVIRGKFMGKGKRDNILSRGKWILIGLREWEITKKEKEKCDLLEVYNDSDKEKLIKNSKENFRIFLSVTSLDDNIDEEQVQFINKREEELSNENTDEEELFDEDANKEYSSSQDSDEEKGDIEEIYESDLDNNYINSKQNKKLEINKKSISSILNEVNSINIDDI